jgi:hypothetical protein
MLGVNEGTNGDRRNPFPWEQIQDKEWRNHKLRINENI